MLRQLKLMTLIIMALCGFACQSPLIEPPAENHSYYSDYFVFISDDPTQPLVIPYDLNWSPTENGYQIEFKGWYGTQSDWPIAYLKQEYKAESSDIPQAFFQHKNIAQFGISAVTRQLALNIQDSPSISLYVPEDKEFIAIPNSTRKTISAARTSVLVDEKIVTGWLLHENIRAPKVINEKNKFGEFTTFFWVPIIVNGNLYHFEQHGEEQTANRWRNENGQLLLDTVTYFHLDIKKTIKDTTSGRSHIPNVISLTVPDWQLSVELESGGSQVGYGDEFPNGLAYYRQSLLTSTIHSKSKAHGMLELIIEND